MLAWAGRGGLRREPHCLPCRPLHGPLEWPHDMGGWVPSQGAKREDKETSLCLTWPSVGKHTPSGPPDSLSEKASIVVALMDGQEWLWPLIN